MPNRMKVLLAESDLASARSVMSALREKGVDVFAANDAIHVLNMARKEQPDAVLLSGQLAGGAVAALRRLRSNVYTTSIPVIAIAGTGEAARVMAQAGAQECMAPPLDFDRLHAALQRNMLQDLDFTQAPAAVLEDADRMAELQESGLLDTPPDESFDRLTRLTARLLDVPAALVSLVDKDRQFFKSYVGLSKPWSETRQTPLSHSFCQWVVSGKEPLVVADATSHPTLKRNLAVRDLGVIAYAGVPLLGRRGEAIGSFCAVDTRPREWSAEDLAVIDSLARISRGYVVLEQEKRWRDKVRDRGAVANLRTSVLVAGNAILGATDILRLHDADPDESARHDLLAIIREQAEHLTRSAG